MNKLKFLFAIIFLFLGRDLQAVDEEVGEIGVINENQALIQLPQKNIEEDDSLKNNPPQQKISFAKKESIEFVLQKKQLIMQLVGEYITAIKKIESYCSFEQIKENLLRQMTYVVRNFDPTMLLVEKCGLAKEKLLIGGNTEESEEELKEQIITQTQQIELYIKKCIKTNDMIWARINVLEKDFYSATTKIAKGSLMVCLGCFGNKIYAGDSKNPSLGRENELIIIPNNFISFIAEYRGFASIFSGVKDYTVLLVEKANSKYCQAETLDRYLTLFGEVVFDLSKLTSRLLAHMYGITRDNRYAF
jgi:hypothetical protein